MAKLRQFTLTKATFAAILHVWGRNNLDTTNENDEGANSPGKVKSVAATILSEFFDDLEKQEDFGEISLRLRKVVLEDGVFAEPSIRAALFPDAS